MMVDEQDGSREECSAATGDNSGKRLWTELRIYASDSVAEALCDFLVSLLGRGVIIEEMTPEGESLNDSADFSTLIKAYLSVEDLESGALKEIEQYIFNLIEFHSGYPVARIAGHEPVLEDWHDSWKRFFKPVHIGRFVIKPTWEPYAPGSNEVIIEIDPGQAFGVGTHASTRLMLLEMERLWQEQGWDGDGVAASELPSVLDVGCGTGILGIAAAKLGAASVHCIDIDPEAVKAARQNVVLNHCRHIVTVSQDPVWKIEPPWTVVLANIDRDTLCLLSEHLAAQLESGGWLIVSGILREQADMVRDAMGRNGLQETRSSVDSGGEWIAIRFRRP